jgi:hypothetical protein
MIRRCKHGMYVSPGETKSPYCTGCVPSQVGIVKLIRWQDPTVRPEVAQDVVNYLHSPVGLRLLDAEKMEAQ